MAYDEFDSATFGSMPGSDSVGGVSSASIIDDGSIMPGDLRSLATRVIGLVVALWAAVSALLAYGYDRGSGALYDFVLEIPAWRYFVSPVELRPRLLDDVSILYDVGGTMLLAPLFLATVAVAMLGVALALGLVSPGLLRRVVSQYVIVIGLLYFMISSDTAVSITSLAVRSIALPVLAAIALSLLDRTSQPTV
ncbi:MAG: hypothetical protein R2710_28450 [Acidimicrobiales bacterium]